MKRVKAACICQTLHFMLKEDAPPAWAAQQIQAEVEQYKIVEETTQSDGSILVKVIKQYNVSPVGDYLN